MKAAVLRFLATFCLSITRTGAQVAQRPPDIILSEATRAMARYFSDNNVDDGTGFNQIDEEEEHTPESLFTLQYGEDASTAGLVAATLDLKSPASQNVSFSDVVQMTGAGEYQDARKGFAAHSIEIVSYLIGPDGLIVNVEEASRLIRALFRSLYDLIGSDRFASFLNLRLGSSLSFVMDTTGSMSGEIAAAKARVVEIVDRTNGTTSAPLNYVLVPYNDPGFGPVTKTSDAVEFIAAVNALSASGGGDIPELAMIGILKAAENSGFRSIVYVFTDAPAKDVNLQNQVIALCLTKKIAVYVFLTTDISRKKRALLSGRSLYDNVAEKTGGAVLLVRKEDIDAATAIMESTTAQGLVALVATSKSNATSVVVNVDSSISSLLVQLTGDFSYLGSTGPKATEVSLADIDGAKLFRIDGVQSGQYRFNFENTVVPPSYGISIRGSSTLGFHAEISQKKAGSDKFTVSRQLIAGQTTRANLVLYGDAANTNFTTFQLVSREGVVLLEETLMRVTETVYRPAADFLLPNQLMVVKVLGTYRGMPLQRIDPCAITPTTQISTLDDIPDQVVTAGSTIQVTTVLHNKGDDDTFRVVTSDNRGFSFVGTTPAEQGFTLRSGQQRTITVTINVPSGTQAGLLSKVIVSATGVNDNYFLFTTFVVSVIDNVIRCPSLISPVGGALTCSPDSRSVGSICRLTCGDEYDLVGSQQTECQADGTWSPLSVGNCRFQGSKTCIVAGDPHFTTFDGRRYDFQGSCLYTLIETHSDSGLEPVTAQAIFGQFYGRGGVTWYKQGFITIGNATIQLKQGRIVLVDGVAVTLPRYINGGRIQIRRDGADVLVKTSFKLEVRLNGRHYFRISLPASYRNKVTGMCGDYDGDSSNDLTIGNVTYSKPSEFGNALEIVGGSEPWCRKGRSEDDELGCNEAQRATYAEKCAAMKSTCFTGCADNATVDRLVQDCIYDLCASGGSNKILQDQISDFAVSCSDRNIQVCNWRQEFGFPIPTCGRNKHYEFQGNRCPNTCVNPTAAQRCIRKPKTEGCFCNAGFVLDGTECIRRSECGCALSGKYYRKGFSFIEQGCTRRCTCTSGLLQCVPMSCDEGTDCRITGSGQYGCEPARVDRCYATGDPHYKTLDGSRFNFMGTCKYIMLTTNGTALADPSRHVTVLAQNEHRGLNTRVSYVRQVQVIVKNLEVSMGPGTKFNIVGNYTSGNNGKTMVSTDGIVTVEDVGFEIRVKTKFGLIVKFAAGTNLYIDVPSFYLNRVSGLCGNYTGSKADDYGGKNIEEFAALNKYNDGCDRDISLEPFVCSDADKAKWGGAEYCGKLKNTTGPFQYCLRTAVDVDKIFDNCVFDACATDGEAIKSALKAFAEECRGNIDCEWEKQLGIAPDCPANSEYTCTSICSDTCQDPEASVRCESPEQIAQCSCSPGYILNNGVCVEESTCGCVLENGAYVEQGYTQTTRDCAQSITCAGPGSLVIKENPCTENSKCFEVSEGEFRCVPNEYAYTLVYGTIHHKTFDGKFFDFRGNCAYLLVGYDSDSPRMPSFRVYVVNARSSKDRIYIKGVIVEIWLRDMRKRVFHINNDKAVMIDSVKYAIGSRAHGMLIRTKRGNVALDFPSGFSVHYNGDDWIRVDVGPQYLRKVHGIGGNYNGMKEDDMLTGDIMHTPEQWGDSWIEPIYSSAMCSRVTPTVYKVCLARKRFERTCDCGMISDPTGPFAACHSRMEPGPFMRSCVTDACEYHGSPMAIFNAMKAYYIACLGKGIAILNFHSLSGIELVCPENSHFSNCTSQCQPSCTERTPICPADTCEEGCVCDDGYIMSNGKCIPEDKCGCIKDGEAYHEHGVCDTNANCTQECTCVYGEWSCEEIGCNFLQECSIRDGIRRCHWTDPCKYDNGGCSDFCNRGNYSKAICSCRAGRVLTKDNVTCVDVSPVFFDDGVPDSCGTNFNMWKAEFHTWQNVYVPKWRKELEDYQKYVTKGIVSRDLDVCQYAWTDWYDIDDPAGCGDVESLEMIRVHHPEICKKPIAAEGRMADGRKLGAMIANVNVDATGLICKNAEQKRGISCPDFAVRFLCRIPLKTTGKKCD